MSQFSFTINSVLALKHNFKSDKCKSQQKSAWSWSAFTYLNSCVIVTVLYAYPAKNSRLIQFRALPTEEEMVLVGYDILPDKFQARNVLRSDAYRWEDGIVYYQLDSVFDDIDQGFIREAFDAIERKTCVRFMEKTDDIDDYVYITGDDTGCNSHVGRQGGEQNMNLQLKGCMSFGTITHEALHSLGFKHQHQAPDRDDYVRIETENIESGQLHNFEKLSLTEVTEFGFPYDYKSIMHYGRKTFSRNGKDTIVPLEDGVKIGRGLELSITDVKKINLMYDCPEKKHFTSSSSSSSEEA